MTTQSNRNANSTEVRTSRYVQGGDTERYDTKLGWWERRNIPIAYDDIYFTVGPEEAGRPDLIAYRLYKKATLMWLILQFNNIIDPIEELVPGSAWRAPSQTRVIMSILTRPTGGIAPK